MEARVNKELSNFLTHHSLQDAICNIDDIVLSYLLGVLDLIGQGQVEDCFDLEDVTEMMNAYLPGFDQIGRSFVLDWMFNLASHLKEKESFDDLGSSVSLNEKNSGDDFKEDQKKGKVEEKKESSFPQFEYDSVSEPLSVVKVSENVAQNSKAKEKNLQNDNKKVFNGLLYESSNGKDNLCKSTLLAESGCMAPSLSGPSIEKEKEQKASSCSKRKKRYLSQSSQEDGVKVQVEIEQEELDKCLVQDLLEMFPALCSMEAKHCLYLADGDINAAAQLIMDRQEHGQSISPSQKNTHKSKKANDTQLDDNCIKSSLIEKYSFIDVTEDEKTHKPPPMKNSAKKLVRYRDGQVVSLKGERFSEIKKS